MICMAIRNARKPCVNIPNRITVRQKKRLSSRSFVLFVETHKEQLIPRVAEREGQGEVPRPGLSSLDLNE